MRSRAKAYGGLTVIAAIAYLIGILLAASDGELAFDAGLQELISQNSYIVASLVAGGALIVASVLAIYDGVLTERFSTIMLSVVVLMAGLLIATTGALFDGTVPWHNAILFLNLVLVALGIISIIKDCQNGYILGIVAITASSLVLVIACILSVNDFCSSAYYAYAVVLQLLVIGVFSVPSDFTFYRIKAEEEARAAEEARLLAEAEEKRSAETANLKAEFEAKYAADVAAKKAAEEEAARKAAEEAARKAAEEEAARKAAEEEAARKAAEEEAARKAAEAEAVRKAEEEAARIAAEEEAARKAAEEEARLKAEEEAARKAAEEEAARKAAEEAALIAAAEEAARKAAEAEAASPVGRIRKACTDRGLSPESISSPCSVPIAFPEAGLAVQVFENEPDETDSRVLDENGWIVLHFAAGEVSDGKKEAEVISEAVSAISSMGTAVDTIGRECIALGYSPEYGYGPHGIPLAFPEEKLAVDLFYGEPDESADAGLEADGWKVIRFDVSELTDGKKEAEVISVFIEDFRCAVIAARQAEEAEAARIAAEEEAARKAAEAEAARKAAEAEAARKAAEEAARKAAEEEAARKAAEEEAKRPSSLVCKACIEAGLRPESTGAHEGTILSFPEEKLEVDLIGGESAGQDVQHSQRDGWYVIGFSEAEVTDGKKEAEVIAEALSAISRMPVAADIVCGACRDKGLYPVSGYGSRGIPVAFPEEKLAVDMFYGVPDESADAGLEADGWKVIRFDVSELTDGKKEAEVISFYLEDIVADAEQARIAAEEEAARKLEEAIAARKSAEEETARVSALLVTEKEAKATLEADYARRAAEEEARLKAEEEARIVAEEEAARLAAEEAEKKAAEAEAAAIAAEEEATRKAAEEQRRVEEEEAARAATLAEIARINEQLASEAEARKAAEEELARINALLASETAALKAAQDEIARRDAEEETRKAAEAEAARIAAEEKAAAREAHEAAQKAAEEEAARKAAEKLQKEAAEAEAEKKRAAMRAAAQEAEARAYESAKLAEDEQHTKEVATTTAAIAAAVAAANELMAKGKNAAALDTVCQACYDRGLPFGREFGAAKIPMAFPTEMLAIYVDDKQNDAQVSELEDEGWTVVRFDPSDVTDGKKEAGVIEDYLRRLAIEAEEAEPEPVPEIQFTNEELGIEPDTVETTVRRLAYNKGLRFRRKYGTCKIPVAFVSSKVAVYVDEDNPDHSHDEKLLKAGWKVFHFDAAGITDGVKEVEQIQSAVKESIKAQKSAAAKAKKAKAKKTAAPKTKASKAKKSE